MVAASAGKSSGSNTTSAARTSVGAIFLNRSSAFEPVDRRSCQSSVSTESLSGEMQSER